MSYLLNMLADCEPAPQVDPSDEADRIAFDAAERELVRSGFAEMDSMGTYAEPRAEVLKVAAYAPRVEVAA